MRGRPPRGASPPTAGDKPARTWARSVPVFEPHDSQACRPGGYLLQPEALPNQAEPIDLHRGQPSVGRNQAGALGPDHGGGDCGGCSTIIRVPAAGPNASRHWAGVIFGELVFVGVADRQQIGAATADKGFGGKVRLDDQ